MSGLHRKIDPNDVNRPKVVRPTAVSKAKKQSISRATTGTNKDQFKPTSRTARSQRAVANKALDMITPPDASTHPEITPLGTAHLVRKPFEDRATADPKVEARRKLVAANLLSGLSVRDIAEVLDVSAMTVQRDVEWLRATWKEEAIANFDHYLTFAVKRLDRLTNAYWKKALGGDLPSAFFLLKLEERRAKILGLDKPTKVAFTDAQGNDLRSLSDAEVAQRLDAALARLGAHRSAKAQVITQQADGTYAYGHEDPSIRESPFADPPGTPTH